MYTKLRSISLLSFYDTTKDYKPEEHNMKLQIMSTYEIMSIYKTTKDYKPDKHILNYRGMYDR